MDVFDKKSIKPMLIKEQREPFNSPDYLYELKLDGIRCIAYINEESTDLRTRNNNPINHKFPELSQIHKLSSEKVILDGELIVMREGVPNFYEVQRRLVLDDKFKIKMASEKLVASFVAYDVIYYKDKEVIDLPLNVRKSMLESVIKENNSLAISRFVIENGIELFNLAEQNNLEGVVGKRLDSKYHYDKRTNDWIKFKRLKDQEFIIAGYILKRPMNVLLLGQYDDNGKLIYRGSVSFGVRLNFIKEYNCKEIPYSPFSLNTENRNTRKSKVVWLEPKLVCSVQYMPGTRDSLREAVFKGIRNDIEPELVVMKS